jgi:hypothetical protein
MSEAVDPMMLGDTHRPACVRCGEDLANPATWNLEEPLYGVGGNLQVVLLMCRKCGGVFGAMRRPDE